MKKVLLLLVVIMGLNSCNEFWAEKEAKADYIKAEYEYKSSQFRKQVITEDAKARLEASKFESQIEVERARGVAEANQIIGGSLKGNDAYLTYLWIQGLQDGSSEVIYIPTEANLPILEARDKLTN